MIQPFPELDGESMADSLRAGARTAKKTGFGVAVVVSRDPGVVAQARLAADVIGDLDVETTITASTIKVCFRPVSPVAAPVPRRAAVGLANLLRTINIRRKRNRV